MSIKTCVTVIAGVFGDHAFNHISFIAESLSFVLPNFFFKRICKSSEEWEPWLKRTCETYGWLHTKSPLIWREIGLTHSVVTYVGGSYQFWELLYQYYNIKSYLTKDDLELLQEDLLFIHNMKEQKCECKKEDVQEKECRQITIVGAGASVCSDLLCELLMTKELWLAKGIVVNLYDKPGCFFKLKKIYRDVKGVGAGLRTVTILDNIPEGLKDCHIMIYLDALLREENEDTKTLLDNNYKDIEALCVQINEYAPSYMKLILCSMGFTCFFANIMHKLITKIPSTNIVAVGTQYGLEMMYPLVVSSLGFTLQNFGCPPVWGYLGINQFVDVDHMVQKCYIYEVNEKLLKKTKSAMSPFQIQSSELRWLFYMAHNQSCYTETFKRKALTEYQVGRSDNFSKCRAICDLLKLWYSTREDVEDVIISLGIASDGSFGIPKGIVFSQPVCLKILEDQSRVWIPFRDFPLPNIPISIFQNLIDTATYIDNRITELIETSDLKEKFQQVE